MGILQRLIGIFLSHVSSEWHELRKSGKRFLATLKLSALLVWKTSVLFSSNSQKLQTANIVDMNTEKVGILWLWACESVSSIAVWVGFLGFRFEVGRGKGSLAYEWKLKDVVYGFLFLTFMYILEPGVYNFWLDLS